MNITSRIAESQELDKVRLCKFCKNTAKAEAGILGLDHIFYDHIFFLKIFSKNTSILHVFSVQF